MVEELSKTMRRTQLQVIQDKLDSLPSPYAPLKVVVSKRPKYQVVTLDGIYICGGNTINDLKSMLWYREFYHPVTGLNIFY